MIVLLISPPLLAILSTSTLSWWSPQYPTQQCHDTRALPLTEVRTSIATVSNDSNAGGCHCLLYHFLDLLLPPVCRSESWCVPHGLSEPPNQSLTKYTRNHDRGSYWVQCPPHSASNKPHHQQYDSLTHRKLVAWSAWSLPWLCTVL